MNMHIDEIDKNAEVLGDKYVSFQGIKLIKELIEEYGLDVVIAYMAHIQVWTTAVSPRKYILVTNRSKFININNPKAKVKFDLEILGQVKFWCF